MAETDISDTAISIIGKQLENEQQIEKMVKWENALRSNWFDLFWCKEGIAEADTNISH